MTASSQYRCLEEIYVRQRVQSSRGPTCQHAQVLHEEARRHDEPCAGDEERQEKVFDVLQLVQRVLLLIGRAQHDARHERPQLRGQPLQATKRAVSNAICTFEATRKGVAAS